MNKPVIIWKVGLTQEGARAASSHTGVMAGSKEIWQNMARQGGAVVVAGFEAFADALMGFYMVHDELGDRIAIILGPGGLVVSAAKACGSHGLRLAQLSDVARNMLSRVVQPTGTSL